MWTQGGEDHTLWSVGGGGARGGIAGVRRVGRDNEGRNITYR